MRKCGKCGSTSHECHNEAPFPCWDTCKGCGAVDRKPCDYRCSLHGAATPAEPESCECDDTHEKNHTCCRYCWAQGYRDTTHHDTPGMTLQEFQKRSQATAQWQPGHPDYQGERHRLYGSLGLCGESGELAEVVKKVVFSGRQFDEAKFLEEGGDTLWYLSCVAEAHGYTLQDFANTVLAKLAKRYPTGTYSHAESIARVDKSA